jgi:hypothetical protein
MQGKDGSSTPKGRCLLRRLEITSGGNTLQRRSAGPILQGMEAGRHQKWKGKSWGQHGGVVPFMWMVIDITGKPPSDRRKQRYACRLLGIIA